VRRLGGRTGAPRRVIAGFLIVPVVALALALVLVPVRVPVRVPVLVLVLVLVLVHVLELVLVLTSSCSCWCSLLLLVRALVHALDRPAMARRAATSSPGWGPRGTRPNR
jgi:hypothetical protein